MGPRRAWQRAHVSTSSPAGRATDAFGLPVWGSGVQSTGALRPATAAKPLVASAGAPPKRAQATCFAPPPWQLSQPTPGSVQVLRKVSVAAS